MSNKRTIIKVRRGTAAEWLASNEVLLLGEPGFEKDTKKLKIGDGITPWNDLQYINDDLLSINDALVFKGTLGTGGTISSLPSVYEAGWTYKVITANTYANKACDIGDFIVSIVDRPDGDGNNDDWAVIQANIENIVSISNPGEDRVLTSDGTFTGINSESNLTFNQKILRLRCECDEGNAGFVGVGDGNIVNFRANQFFDENVEPPRLIFRRTRGSEASPQIANSGDGIFAVRGESIDYNGNVNILGGIRMQIVEPASSTSLNPATKIFLRTSSGGDNLLDKTLTLNSDGTLVNTGPIKVNNTQVSLEGHTHTVSEITDFNEAVDDRIGSGLFVAGTGINLNYNDAGNSFTVSASGLISNPTDNRILTSRDSTTTGIDAESNLTFDGSLLSVSGNLVANTGNLDVLYLNTNIEPTLLQGQMAWNDTAGTVDVALTDAAIINVGEHEMFRVRNETGGVLYKGQAVMASGVHANGIIEPSLYTANGSVREVRFMGLVYENINDNNNGYVIHFGHVNNIDTRGNVASNIAVGDETWADGDILYVHPTVAGKLTNVEPKHNISVAIVLDAAINGKIFVRATSYGHLEDNHDVNVSGVTDGQYLQYNAATDYWIPTSSGNFTTLDVASTGDIGTLKINNFYHQNLAIASGIADNDLLMVVVDPTGSPSTEVIQGSILRSSLLNQPAQLQFRQGTDVERLLITPASGEPIWTTDTQKFYIGDGTTVGGDFMGPSPYTRGSSVSSIVALNFGCAASGNRSVVCGGFNNVAIGFENFVGGGSNNISNGNTSIIVGGLNNRTSGIRSTIGGGGSNNASGDASTIPGGASNVAKSNRSFVAGSVNIAAQKVHRANNITSSTDTLTILDAIAADFDDTTTDALQIIYFNNTFSSWGKISSTVSSAIQSGNDVTLVLTTNVGASGQTFSKVRVVNIAETDTESDQVVQGAANIASVKYSAVGGGFEGKASRYGETSHAAGAFDSNGDAQHTVLIARKLTTDNTSNQALFLDGSSARLTLPAKTSWTFEIKLSAYNDTDNAAAGWIYRGVIRRDNANSTTIVGSLIEESWKDTAMDDTSTSVTADDTNEALEIRVTGLTDKNIRWVAVVDISQVSYGTP
jgi:hypothetical protein